jgi:hypothetical protein
LARASKGDQASTYVEAREQHLDLLSLAPRGEVGVGGGNARLHDECLNEMLFPSFSYARAVPSNWRGDHNHVRPHSRIGGLTPADAVRQVALPIRQGTLATLTLITTGGGKKESRSHPDEDGRGGSPGR